MSIFFKCTFFFSLRFGLFIHRQRKTDFPLTKPELLENSFQDTRKWETMGLMACLIDDILCVQRLFVQLHCHYCCCCCCCYFCFSQVDMFLSLRGYIATAGSGLRLTSAGCMEQEYVALQLVCTGDVFFKTRKVSLTMWTGPECYDTYPTRALRPYPAALLPKATTPSLVPRCRPAEIRL